ncbi:MAG TPA: glycosyltransferase family 1 protein [Terriglobales bacterium]|nr:glycosyltransferase family 1 protein [Terriglobales bacterium]
MIHLFINAGSASAGGGLTYLRNFVTELLGREDVGATILVSAQGARLLSLPSSEPSCARIRIVRCPWGGTAPVRYWREQWELPRMIRSAGADVLLSTGNVALRHSPVPQILLSRNALYTTPEFFRDLRARRDYFLWMMESCKRVLAKRSVDWAECTIAPSVAFAKQMQAWTGREIIAIHHGFDAKAFFASREVPEDLITTLKAAEGCVRLLFVSHYNYYRNFETLLRALPRLRKQLAPTPVRLFLTGRLCSEMNPGSYQASYAAALVRELGIDEEVVQLGTVPYGSLHHLYRACDVYVTPAYAESFAHPLIEAMASGLPIIASDLPVHREICRDAAIYKPTFSPDAFAEAIVDLVRSPERRRCLAEAGQRRSVEFSWVDHVEQITRIAKQLASARGLPTSLTAAVPC